MTKIKMQSWIPDKVGVYAVKEYQATPDEIHAAAALLAGLDLDTYRALLWWAGPDGEAQFYLNQDDAYGSYSICRRGRPDCDTTGCFDTTVAAIVAAWRKWKEQERLAQHTPLKEQRP